MIVIALMCAVIVWEDGGRPATAEEIKAVVVASQTSVAASFKLKTMLKDVPAPTVSQLNEMRTKVEALLMLERVRAGDSERREEAASETDKERSKDGTEDVVASLVSGPLKWLIVVGLVVPAVAAVMRLVRIRNRA